MSDAEGYHAIAEAEAEAADKGRRTSWLRRHRWALIILGPLLILAIAGYFVLTGGRSQATDNAYVEIGKAPISASVAGRVTDIYVHENQHVKKGELLFRLDSRDFTAQLDEAAARVADTRLQVSSQQADYRQQQAKVRAAQETVVFAESETRRQKALVAAGVSSRQQYDQAAHTAQLAHQDLAVAQQQAAAALAALGGAPNAPVSSHPSVLAAEATLERARLNQSYAGVVAPVDGIVTRVDDLQVGGYVNASQTLFYLLSGQPWVEANFKEDQLTKMRVGQPAKIKLSAFPDTELTGHVASFSPGTGAVFSALPAQNATGNWVKVVQRLPVRIVFDRAPPEIATRAGLSATVTVDVQDHAAKTAAPR